MELNKPFSVPAVLGAETSAAEAENHWVFSLQFGELPTFRGVIGKLIVGEDCPGNNVRSHIQPPFLLEHDHSSLFCKNLRGLVSLKFWIEEKVDSASAASRDLLNPLAPPGGRLEGIREILCLAHDLSVAELHNTHCVCWSPLVRDCVFRDPEFTVSENSLDVEARRLAGMVTSQGLQIASPE